MMDNQAIEAFHAAFSTVLASVDYIDVENRTTEGLLDVLNDAIQASKKQNTMGEYDIAYLDSLHEQLLTFIPIVQINLQE